MSGPARGNHIQVDAPQSGAFLFLQTRRYAFRSANDPAMVVRGRGLYEKRCASCHGLRGRGRQGYSCIAGLPQKYVSSTLTHFREKSGGRTSALMADVASTLSNDDIDVLSAFISSLR